MTETTTISPARRNPRPGLIGRFIAYLKRCPFGTPGCTDRSCACCQDERRELSIW